MKGWILYESNWWKSISILYYCSDGWTMDDLIYEWKAEEPVQIVDNLNLPRFKLEHYDTDSCNTLTNTGMSIRFDYIWCNDLNYIVDFKFYKLLTCVQFILGEYSCLRVNLLFKREFSYYLLTIYVPSCMLVIVSWVSFWLDSKVISIIDFF